MLIKFLDVINDFFLEQLILEPTEGEAILHLILSNTQDLVQKRSAGEPLGNSDHNIITFDNLAGGSKLKKSSLH